MVIRRISAIIAVALLGAAYPSTVAAQSTAASTPAAGPVAPDKPDKLDDGESDETRPRRQGFAIGVGLGPSILVGFRRSEDQVTGVGGALNLRLGTVATDKLLWFLEGEGAAYEILTEDGVTLSRQQTTLTLGGHYYVREVFWFGAGLGVAWFRSAETRSSPDGEQVIEAEETKAGVANRYTAGVDLFRSGIFALAAEVGVAIGVYEGEQLSNLTIRMSGSWY
jgi:hypothetical protein